MEIRDLGTTTPYDGLTWLGAAFAEPAPQLLWLRLPACLRAIAVEEMARGNSAICILENRESNIVVLCLKTGPLTDHPADPAIRVHTRHELGNYCYDGTKATLEHLPTGCFLVFDDPAHDDAAF